MGAIPLCNAISKRCCPEWGGYLALGRKAKTPQVLGPQRKFMCRISLKSTQESDPLNFSGDAEVRRGVPNLPFLAIASLVYVLLPAFKSEVFRDCQSFLD